MTELRPGDRVRAFTPGLEDSERVSLLAGQVGVVTLSPVFLSAPYVGVVFYDERGDAIPTPGSVWSPDEFDDPQWPLNPWHRCVWLMLDGELELIEDNSEEGAA